MTTKLETVIIYEGPSLLDGAPIVVLAQRGSRNSKTGNMLQTFILRADMDPITANRIGADYSICGDCSLKGTPQPDKTSGLAKGRGCYVTLIHAPLGKYKAYTRGSYPSISGHEAIKAFGAGLLIRIGTYGDGAAVPSYVWDSLTEDAKGWTAYTHQTGVDGAATDPERFMTSADSLEQAAAAWSRGERTFRVVPKGGEIDSNEILCPASEEMGKRTTCERCKLCAGNSVKAKSIAIFAHGNGANHVVQPDGEVWTITTGVVS